MTPLKLTTRYLLRFATVTAIAVPGLAVAQGTARKSGFVVKKGKDTVAVELYSRDASTLTSEIYQSTGLRTQYTATVGQGGAIKYVEMTRQGRQGRVSTPFLAVSFALCEQILRASHLEVGKSQTWTAFRLGVADTATLTATRFHADSVLFAMPDVQLKVAISAAGDVIGGRHMGQDWLIERRAGK